MELGLKSIKMKMGLDLVIFTIVIGADKQKGKNEC